MTRRIAIVPARGGSKRIARKNIREFCGKPIILYTLEAATKSQLFDTIHVSTEDSEIAMIVENEGYNIDFMRPLRLADDYTPLIEVLRYVIEKYQEKDCIYDEIWLLMACAPNITSELLKEASILLEKSESQMNLVTVSEYPVPIEWAFRKNSKNELEHINKEAVAIRSQDLTTHYYDTGTFAVFNVQQMAASLGSFDDGNYIGFVLPKGSAIDIDNEEDWVLAEKIYQAK